MSFDGLLPIRASMKSSDVAAAVCVLRRFIAAHQLSAMLEMMAGEEGAFFAERLVSLARLVEGLPKPYRSESSEEPMAQLHYFVGSCDWWIVERDSSDEQLQCFGLSCLNGDTANADLGYINISELVDMGVELDLYFEPRPLKEIREQLRR